MADNDLVGENSSEGTEEKKPKKWTDEDLAAKIMHRVRNLRSENEEYKKRLEELQQAQAAPIAPEQQEAVPSPTQAPPSPGQAQQPDINELMSNQTDAIKQAISQERQNAIVENSRSKIRNMIDSDKDFGELATNKNGQSHSVPEEVALHIASQFEPKVAKGILKDLLSNKIMHLHMENAYLKGDEEYSKWLSQLMANKAPENKTIGDAPDLSGEGGEASDSSFGNTEDLIRDMY